MQTIALTLAAVLVGTGALCADKSKFTDTFPVEKAELASVGTNRFFNLVPGYQMVLEGREGGKATVLTITVLNETRMVDGVATRVVEEKETAGGELVEISRNFFAISQRTSDVFYFGEEVDIYKAGQVVGHEGAWLSGVGGAHFGLAMPGRPLLGARYYQEVAPKVAMDRAEVLSLSELLKSPAGKFEHCLQTEETSAIEKVRERKLYAPGIGLIKDGDMTLTKYGYGPR
ncbi:MAG TPA: hypothetical protein VNT26_13565 [Candidatus Sulfotelmatobacter sp.]|nr:hypothetical protein [Candidatus Sulfotelmatobacter sp.]HWI58646.1 hypothetical protein [Bacillota bacterium]